MSRFNSWGNYPPGLHHGARDLTDRYSPLPATEGTTLLPRGNGRSYGDSCLNHGGWLLTTRGLNRFIAFDPGAGILRCEAGVLLAEILALVVQRGWFLAVTPGTRLVTVGGAIANDVHGKNHHLAGSFGNHLLQFELLRSDGSRLLCSPTSNPEWFAATIGGLGLTGVITWAELALKRINNPWIQQQTIRYSSLEEFAQLSTESDRDFEYTVSWIDCLSAGDGRGIFFRGNHAAPLAAPPATPREFPLVMPLTPPFSLVNRVTGRLFNSLYYHRAPARATTAVVHYQPFFYPLDGIAHWNRMYGQRGFLQYQCVIPSADGLPLLRELRRRVAASGAGSFLAVLKKFGEVPSLGPLSFPRPGYTLAMDLPFHGEESLQLLDDLDTLVATVGGAVYPAKDARMRGERFRQFFPRWEEFGDFIDPGISSSFWRRVMGGE